MASDLHIHTTFSDGRFTPEEILNAAKEVNLNYIAITDHDTVDGVRYMYEQGLYPNKWVNIIPGIEFSSNKKGHEVHILGYGVDIYSPKLLDALNEVAEARWVRFSGMLENLKKLGYEITEADVLRLAGTSQSVGRAHIARVLVKNGYFTDIKTVFKELLSPGKSCYIENFSLEPNEIVKVIRQAGGMPVLAHPKLIEDDVLVELLLTLDFAGLEVFYPSHTYDEILKYKKMAEEKGLFLSGGSDFHGFEGRFPEKLGDFTVEDEFAKKFFSELLHNDRLSR